ncbi:MAG TPA: hypothetical protein VES73_11235 [Lamprocystis sp. (in: g-proteobacteria)]|nr:hypothetical protein [Lamprocystis sp. (in: g-proteobacteria)]
MTDPHSTRDLAVLVDRLILEQGRLEPLELLMACDYLAYADYEAWRLGQVPDLEGALRVPADQAAAVLGWASRFALAQRLVEEPLEHRAWGSSDQTLLVGPHAELSHACLRAFAPPADRIQLDLFQDSQFQVLEEAVRAALTGRRIHAAHAALTRLMALDQHHPRLPRYLRLMQTVEDLPALPVAERLDTLEAMEPEARDLLGHRARDLLAPLWAALAEDLAGRPFDPAAPGLHGGFAWARAGRHPEARQALESDADWQRSPPLLIAHAQACCRMADVAAARRDWVQLCWQYPNEAVQALSAKDSLDPQIHRLWRQFGDTDLDLETPDFPAWLLLADPGSAAAVPPDQAPSGPVGEAYRLLHQLVAGQGGISERKALAKRHPDLLKLYLATLGGKAAR